MGPNSVEMFRDKLEMVFAAAGTLVELRFEAVADEML